MNGRTVLTAVLITVVATVILYPLAGAFMSSGVVMTAMSPDDWRKIETMPYREACAYMRSRSRLMSGWEKWVRHFRSAASLRMLLKSLLPIGAVNLVLSLAVAFAAIRLNPRETNHE